MLNKNFDPYADLLSCQHNIQELIKAYASHQETIKELLNQNRKLNEMIKFNRIETAKLNLEIQALSEQIFKKDQL